MPPPSSPPAQMVSSNHRYRSPAYYRRQARRKSKRETIGVTDVNLAELVRADENEPSEIEDEPVRCDDYEVEELVVSTEAVGTKVAEELSDLEDARDSPDEEDDSEKDTIDDLGEQLKAVIQESKKKQENWSKKNFQDGNG